jgi:DNA-binding response OmpR family regulator
MSYRIMVVDPDAADLLMTADVLRRAGHRAMTASNFHQAKQLLEANSPDLLITEIRLGAFNGLHLAVRREMLQPHSASIVATAYADRMLEHEARAMNVPVVFKPIDAGELLSLVDKMLSPHPNQPASIFRKWPRRRITGGFDATAGGTPAVVLNVSDDGVGLEIYESSVDMVPATFELAIPAFGFAVSASSVWKSIDGRSGIVRCGAMLVPGDETMVGAWREFVDALA